MIARSAARADVRYVASSVGHGDRAGPGGCDTAGVGIDWAHQLAEQLDRHRRGRFRPRCEGLTDAEYFWEPVANAWSIRPRGHGRAAITAGGGDSSSTSPIPSPARRRSPRSRGGWRT